MAAPAFTVDSAALAKALREIRGAIRGTNTIPVLNNVLLDARGGTLRLTATNLDMMVSRALGAEVEREGHTTINAERLSDIAGALASGSQARLAPAENSLAASPPMTLVSGRGRFRFATLPPTDFPDMPFGTPAAEFSIEAKPLLAALNTVRHASASANEKARTWLAGVHAQPIEGVLRFTATDGNRAARWSMPAPAGADRFEGAILGNALVEVLCSRLGDHEGQVSLAFTDRMARADFGDFVVTAKHVEGRYPDVDRLIPEATPIVVRTDSDDLAGALKRIALMRTDRDSAVNLAVAPEEIAVVGTAIGTGEEGIEKMPCEYGGAAFDIAFRSNFLRDALGALDTDAVELGITETFGVPVSLRSAARPEAVLLVMPFRL